MTEEQIIGLISKESEKAMCVNSVWLPKSQINIKKREGEKVTLELPKWLYDSYMQKMRKTKFKVTEVTDKDVKEMKANKKGEKTIISTYEECPKCKRTCFVVKKSKLCVECLIESGRS